MINKIAVRVGFVLAVVVFIVIASFSAPTAPYVRADSPTPTPTQGGGSCETGTGTC